jgi:GTP diphosphokinase / guanosine-3',5'-bis(diphosphate) 3'-diphosphatase
MQRFGHQVARIVTQVSDDKSLPKEERKRQQIEHARHVSDGAKLIRLADQIFNLRDLAARPPAGWSAQRKTEYFDWARRVADERRGVHPTLDALFDAAYSEGVALSAQA